MKFAFDCRMTVETQVLVEAETEQAAWAKALSAEHKIDNVEVDGTTKIRKPIFVRRPARDEYDL